MKLFRSLTLLFLAGLFVLPGLAVAQDDEGAPPPPPPPHERGDDTDRPEPPERPKRDRMQKGRRGPMAVMRVLPPCLRPELKKAFDELGEEERAAKQESLKALMEGIREAAPEGERPNEEDAKAKVMDWLKENFPELAEKADGHGDDCEACANAPKRDRRGGDRGDRPRGPREGGDDGDDDGDDEGDDHEDDGRDF